MIDKIKKELEIFLDYINTKRKWNLELKQTKDIN